MVINDQFVKTHSKSSILWKDAFFTDNVFNRKLSWIGKKIMN